MKRIPLRFSLGSLLLLVVIVAMTIAWWQDHARLEHGLLNAQTRLAARELLIKDLERRNAAKAFGYGGGGAFGYSGATGYGGVGGGVAQPVNKSPYQTPAEFVEALRNTRDFEEFQSGMADFVPTTIADEALPSLIALFKDPDPEIRARAVQTVGSMGWFFYPAPAQRWTGADKIETVVSSMVPLLNDNDQNVRWTAVAALGMLGKKVQSALPALQKIIDSESSQVAAEAAGTVFKIDPSIEVEPRLQEFLRNGDHDTRFRTLLVLNEIANERPVAKATEDALLEAYRAAEDEASKRPIAQLLERIEEGPKSR